MVPFWQLVEEGTDGGWEPSEEEAGSLQSVTGAGRPEPHQWQWGRRRDKFRSREMFMSQDLVQGDCSPPEVPWVWSPSRADVCTPLGPSSSTLPCDWDTCSLSSREAVTEEQTAYTCFLVACSLGHRKWCGDSQCSDPSLKAVRAPGSRVTSSSLKRRSSLWLEDEV